MGGVGGSCVPRRQERHQVFTPSTPTRGTGDPPATPGHCCTPNLAELGCLRAPCTPAGTGSWSQCRPHPAAASVKQLSCHQRTARWSPRVTVNAALGPASGHPEDALTGEGGRRLCVCVCVRACVHAHQRVRRGQTEPPRSPRLQAQVADTRKGSCGQRPARPHRKHSRRLLTLLGARWDAACRSPDRDAAGPCTRDAAATGGTSGNAPNPPCPGRAALLLTCRADLAIGRLQRNLCGEGPQPCLGFMKFPMGSELGKKLRSHPSRILAIVTTLGQKSLLGHLCRPT